MAVPRTPEPESYARPIRNNARPPENRWDLLLSTFYHAEGDGGLARGDGCHSLATTLLRTLARTYISPIHNFSGDYERMYAHEYVNMYMQMKCDLTKIDLNVEC